MKAPINVLIVLASLTAVAQSTPVVGRTEQKEFFDRMYASNGFSLLTAVRANLDGAHGDDLIQVFAKDGEDTLSTKEHPIKRVLIILLQQPDTRFSCVAGNDNLVYFFGYDENFGDAFVDITTEPLRFTINHYGGFATRWGRATTFAYDAKLKDFIFERDEYSTFKATDPDTPLKETITTSRQLGTVRVGNFDIYKLK